MLSNGLQSESLGRQILGCVQCSDAAQIISGKGNPLAKAAARGLASGEGSMQRAAAYDLDILQRLAVTETTLAGSHGRPLIL